MCGRARCTMGPDNFARACHLDARPVRHINMDRHKIWSSFRSWYQPSYNVAPGSNLPVVCHGGEGDSNAVVLHCMKWGLVPSFTKKNEKIDHFKMFNARSESITEKASFRRLIPKNRCLVTVEGFYEWKKDGSRKQPYYIHLKDGRPLVFAGLFDSWKNSEGDVLYTFTIITTSSSSSSSSLEWLHDRMPVILGDKESTDCWLDGAPLSNLDKLLKPYDGSDLDWYPVTPAMAKLSFNGPECIKEIKMEQNKSISQFFSKKEERTSTEPILENATTKEAAAEAGELKNVEQESESLPVSGSMQAKHGSRRGNDAKELKEGRGNDATMRYQQKGVKEEAESQDDIYAKGDLSSASPKEMLEDVKISVHDKPFAKEDQCSSARKKSRIADDKQSTLFSYFGRG